MQHDTPWFDGFPFDEDPVTFPRVTGSSALARRVCCYRITFVTNADPNAGLHVTAITCQPLRVLR